MKESVPFKATIGETTVDMALVYDPDELAKAFIGAYGVVPSTLATRTFPTEPLDARVFTFRNGSDESAQHGKHGALVHLPSNRHAIQKGDPIKVHTKGGKTILKRVTALLNKINPLEQIVAVEAAHPSVTTLLAEGLAAYRDEALAAAQNGAASHLSIKEYLEAEREATAALCAAGRTGYRLTVEYEDGRYIAQSEDAGISHLILGEGPTPVDALRNVVANASDVLR